VILTQFDDIDAMVGAIRAGRLDYARGIDPGSFRSLEGRPDIVTVEGLGNSYAYLAFNGYPRPIEGGGASTRAVADPAFRDALAWAVDNEALVDSILAGYGAPGTSLLPPFQTPWYVAPEPDVQRHFDPAEADERLDAAGYITDTSGTRLDRDGRPIRLRMTWPESEVEFASVARLITEWWADLGISVDAGPTDDGALLAGLTPPESDPPGKADFDTYLWRWTGDVDPITLLQPFTTDEIGASSDTFWSDPRYDELFELQRHTLDRTERGALLREMQEIFYREVPNIPLYYPSELHAYRTDRFTGWRNQPPEGGTPLFGFGPIGYTLLTAASREPSPSPTGAASPSATASSIEPGTETPGRGASAYTGSLIVLATVVAAAIVGTVAIRIRRRPVEPTEPE
jgi:peptide/nickel transport system substrate-binding protein